MSASAAQSANGLGIPVAGVSPSRPSFASSLAAILGGQAACSVIALLTEISYARILGPASRGIISLCLMSVYFGALLGGLGGEGTIVLWSSRSKNSFVSWLPAVLSWGVVGCTVASVLWTLIYWRVRPAFLHGISPSLAHLVLPTIPAAVLFAYTMALFSGAERFRLRSGFALLRQLLILGSFLVFILLLGRTPEAALLGNLVGLVLASVAALVVLRESLRGFWNVPAALRSFLPTLSYGVRGQTGNLATFFTYRLDVFIVNYFLDPAQLGFYAVGVVVSEALWQIPLAAGLALFPRTARTIEQDATQFTCFIMRQVFLITSLCGMVIAILSPVFIPLVFGVSFRPSVPVIWWILPGTIALSLGKVACADLAGRGKNGYSSVFALICFAITILLDWLLIPRMGILGAALASSSAYFIDALLILIALRYELRVSWKTLLVPTRDDLNAYRLSWLRFKAALGFASPRQPGAEVIFSSQEGS